MLCRVLYKKREVLPGKANMGSYYYDEMSSASSLPPLMDSYITFDQNITQTSTQQDDNNNNTQYEQVPCFSMFSQNQTNINNNPSFMSSHNMMEPNLIPTTFEGISSPGDLVGPYLNPPYGCDKDVLKLVLNHLTKIETSSTDHMKTSSSLGETSSESYLYI